MAGAAALSLRITLIKLPKDSWHVMGCCGSYFVSDSKAVCECRSTKGLSASAAALPPPLAF